MTQQFYYKYILKMKIHMYTKLVYKYSQQHLFIIAKKSRNKTFVQQLMNK
jgi:hypothetical protein